MYSLWGNQQPILDLFRVAILLSAVRTRLSRLIPFSFFIFVCFFYLQAEHDPANPAKSFEHNDIVSGVSDLGDMSLLSNPNITVRLANPQFDYVTGEYCLDIEFQSDQVGQEIFGMNVRFFYDDDILELIDFRDFQGGYEPIAPNPPTVATSGPGVGYDLFGFGSPGTGVADFVNGAFQLLNENLPPIYISTTEWTKLFQICFTIDEEDPDVENFCPPIVWDLHQDPANGGFLLGDDGVVITVVDTINGISEPAFEHVVQFNWEYIGNGTPPYGQPVNDDCVVINCAPEITCPADLTIDCGDSSLPTNTGFATAIDTCQCGTTITYSDTTLNGQCGDLTVIVRSWIATDSCGNQSTCTQAITILQRGSVCGTVFNDLGQPMAGVELRLLTDVNSNQSVDAGDTVIAVVYSEAGTGHYCFTQLEPCDYIVQEIQPSGHGDLSDYDHTPDPDGDDSADGPDNEIPVTLAPCEVDSNNNFINIVCPLLLPALPPDTICENGSVIFEIDDLNIGSLTYTWNFGSGSDPLNGNGLGPHTVSYITTTENQINGAAVVLDIYKEGCPVLTGQISQVEINPYPDAAIDASTSTICYYANKTFSPVQPVIPGATYQWNFGAAAVPATATGYGPHNVYYTASGSKTVKLVIYPNAPGAQCPDSATLVFNVISCPAQILGYVRSVTGGPISGVNLRLYTDVDTNGVADNSTAVRSVFSTSTGSYSMASLTPGHYVIVQTQPAGWFSADDFDDSDDGDIVDNIDTLDNLIPVSLLPSEVDSFNNFIESPIPGLISGTVYSDLDGDEIPDAGEGIPAVIVALFEDNNADGIADSGIPVDTQVTSSSGAFLFTNVPVGNFVLVESQPAGYLSVKDFDASNDGDVVANSNMLNDTLPVTVLNGEHDEHNYFMDVLECSLMVTNTDDAGPGSLRDAVECANAGDTILFMNTLSGQTIMINSERIVIDKEIYILSSQVNVNIASQISGLFDIEPGMEVEFTGMDIISGLAGNLGAAFNNSGILRLHDVRVLKNPLLPPGEYLIYNGSNGQLFLSGNCTIELD